MKVAKFGGTSLASAGQVKKICAIITSDPKRTLVVVSAPGKRDRADTKVTDLLIEMARARLTNQDGQAELARVVEIAFCIRRVRRFALFTGPVRRRVRRLVGRVFQTGVVDIFVCV